jgi:histidine triad (HIT) family protein
MENDTIFGKIIRGEIPASKVYEDEEFLAFLDINPVRKGHTLLMPKEQYQWVQDVPNELISKTFIKMKELIITIKKATMCDYVQVVIEGIQVPHFHIHLIPSMNGQENAKWTHLNYEDGEAEVVAEKIKSSL